MSFGWPFRITTALVGVAFFVAVVVQYHDPDPLPRMALYGAAAILSLLSAIRVLPPRVPGVLGSLAFVWAVALAPSVFPTQLPAALRHGTLLGPETQASRQFLMLLAIAAWMAASAARSARHRLDRSGALGALPAVGGRQSPVAGSSR